MKVNINKFVPAMIKHRPVIRDGLMFLYQKTHPCIGFKEENIAGILQKQLN